MKSILFVLVSFIAFTSLLSGLVMMSNPDGGVLNLSTSLLEGSPFKDFKIPGILLTVIVGGANLAAVFFNLLRHPNRYNWTLAGGIIIIGWIIIQMILIHSIHWLHFIYLATGVIIVLLSIQLKGKALF